MNTIVLLIAVLMIFVALFIGIAVAFGLGRTKNPDAGRLTQRLGAFESQQAKLAKNAHETPETALGNHELTRKTVEYADRVVKSRGFEDSLAASLAAADVKLRPSEWMVIHLGTTIAISLLFFFLSDMAVVAGAVGLGFGVALPYLFLSYKRNKRRGDFYKAMPDMLQLCASSLAAGHSLPQAFDAVAKGMDGPMAQELGRAIAEARLGAELEDTLDQVAIRMDCPDLAWVVMAIRIQREVGGNLAEVLNSVADTLRGRERLNRQVKSLSAEGRLSAVIIGGLPFVFTIYLVIARPDYLAPLYTTPMGIVLMVFGIGMMAVGVLWLRKTVRVEV